MCAFPVIVLVSYLPAFGSFHNESSWSDRVCQFKKHEGRAGQKQSTVVCKMSKMELKYCANTHYMYKM